MLFHNYKQRVLSVGRGNLIGYWPMDEHAGGVAVDASPESNNGAYTGGSLNNAAGPDGRGSPRSDGATSYNDIYSLGLIGDLDFNNGTCFMWVKVFNAGVWTDGSKRYFIRFWADGNNAVEFSKLAANNTVQFARWGSGTLKLNRPIMSPTAWFNLGMTYDTTADEMKVYINGVREVTLTTIGVFVGNPLAGATVIGAGDTSPTGIFNGWLAHAALWKTALSEAEMGILGKI